MSTWRHLQERWLAAWLFRSWFCTDDKSAKTSSWFWQERKDAGGRACADRFSYQITVLESVRRPCTLLCVSLLGWTTRDQLWVIRDEQAFSAVEIAREEYFFCGPSPGMFLLNPCLSLMTSQRVLCSLRNSKLAYYCLHITLWLEYLEQYLSHANDQDSCHNARIPSQPIPEEILLKVWCIEMF